MTETSPVVFQHPVGSSAFGSVGKLVPNTEAKVSFVIVNFIYLNILLHAVFVSVHECIYNWNVQCMECMECDLDDPFPDNF